jgi:predicted membrane protein
LACIAGALEVVNEIALPIGPQWHAYITVGLTFVAGLGISPLVGIAFRNALHLPQSVSVAISSVLAAITLALTQLAVPSGWKSVIGFVLMFLSGVGFGPAWGGTVSKAQALVP